MSKPTRSYEEAWLALRAENPRLGLSLRVTPNAVESYAMLHGAINDESGRELCCEQTLFDLGNGEQAKEARDKVANRLLDLWQKQTPQPAAKPAEAQPSKPETSTPTAVRPPLWNELTAMGIDEKYLRLENSGEETLIVVDATASRLFEKELNLLKARRAGATRTLSVPRLPAAQGGA